MGSTFFGKVLRIPGASGSTFKFFNPTFASASSYESSMTGDGVAWVTPFDASVGCPCFLNLGFPCMELYVVPTGESYLDCTTGSSVTATGGPAGPTGVLTPNAHSGSFPTVYSVSLTASLTTPSLVTGTSPNGGSFQVSSSAILTPGTLLPGNQWYVDTVVSAPTATLLLTWSGIPGPGTGSAVTFAYDAILCLLDFSAGLSVPPTVTTLASMGSFSSSSTVSPSSVALAGATFHVPVGLTLPSQFVIAVGINMTSVPSPGDVYSTHFISPSGTLFIAYDGVNSGEVVVPNGITSSISQAV